MTALKILAHPDERLREISEPVTEFGDELKTLVQDMVDTLEVKGGAGLAAPQIGFSKRVIVLRPKLFVEESPDASYSPDTWVLVNPVVRTSGSTQRWQEACLSVPMGTGLVDRHEECEVKYQRLDGSEHTVTVKWPLSGCIQHEADHLNGVLYLDRVGAIERSMIIRKIEKARRESDRRAEEKKQQEILDLRGTKALLKYRAEKSGKVAPDKRREKPRKKFGQQKKGK